MKTIYLPCIGTDPRSLRIEVSDQPGKTKSKNFVRLIKPLDLDDRVDASIVITLDRWGRLIAHFDGKRYRGKPEPRKLPHLLYSLTDLAALEPGRYMLVPSNLYGPVRPFFHVSPERLKDALGDARSVRLPATFDGEAQAFRLILCVAAGNRHRVFLARVGRDGEYGVWAHESRYSDRLVCGRQIRELMEAVGEDVVGIFDFEVAIPQEVLIDESVPIAEAVESTPEVAVATEAAPEQNAEPTPISEPKSSKRRKRRSRQVASCMPRRVRPSTWPTRPVQSDRIRGGVVKALGIAPALKLGLTAPPAAPLLEQEEVLVSRRLGWVASGAVADARRGALSPPPAPTWRLTPPRSSALAAESSRCTGSTPASILDAAALSRPPPRVA